MDNSNEVYVRYKFGENEMEARGSEDFVNQHSMAFLRAASNNAEQMSLPMLDEVSEKLVDTVEQGTIVTDVKGDDNILHKYTINDLLDFFLKKSPKSQSEEVMVISYFFQKHLEKEILNLDDYTSGYNVLKKAAVKTPSNMKSGVRNVVDRTDYLYNPSRGEFTLTLQGERYVENMNNEE